MLVLRFKLPTLFRRDMLISDRLLRFLLACVCSRLSLLRKLAAAISGGDRALKTQTTTDDLSD